MADKPLKLVNGKFYRGDVEVPPEIGNKEQIRLLQAELKKYEAAEGQGSISGTVDSEEIITYYPIIKFECPRCKTKNSVHMEDETSEYTFDSSDVEHYDVECTKCNLDLVIGKVEGSNHKISLTYELEDLK